MADVRRLAARAQELRAARREADPLLTWRTRALTHQDAFLQSQAGETWILAANRVGKTEGLGAEGASMARFGCLDPLDVLEGRVRPPYRKTLTWAVSLTREMSRTLLQPHIFDNGAVPPGAHKPFIPDHEIDDWNKQEQTLKLKPDPDTGESSMILFKSADQGWQRAQGGGIDLALFDEACAKPFYDETTTRVAAGRRLWIRGAATLLPPPGMAGGISWLYGEKVVPFQQKKVARMDLALIGASIFDNPHLLKVEVDRLLRLYPEGTKEHAIRILGEWLPDIGGHRAYGPFSRLIHVRPGLHPTDKIEKLPLLFGVDFNKSPFGAVVCQRRLEPVQQRPIYRVLTAIKLDLATVTDMAEEFCHRFPWHDAPCYLHGDATGNRWNEQSGKSNFLLMLAVLKRLPYPTKLKVPPRNPYVKDRLAAVNRALLADDSFIGVELSDDCEELTADFEQVILGPSGEIKKSDDPNNPYSRRTAYSDAFGYIVTWYDPVTVASLRDPGERVRDVPAPSYGFGGRAPSRYELPRA